MGIPALAPKKSPNKEENREEKLSIFSLESFLLHFFSASGGGGCERDRWGCGKNEEGGREEVFQNRRERERERRRKKKK